MDIKYSQQLYVIANVRQKVKLKNICGFDTIDRFVAYKIEEYRKQEKTLETLFEFMFSESDNVMAEITDGYRIKKTTYGQFKADILGAAPSLASELSDVPPIVPVAPCRAMS